MSEYVNGLSLSREYFMTEAAPRLQNEFDDLYPRLAAGLVGNGSECFGYDDEISRDHDWGIDFFIWVTEEDRKYIPELRYWKACLFRDHPPEYTSIDSAYGKTVDVMTCGDFYQHLIGVTGRPKSLDEWRRVPEENIALAVNGEVFLDGSGEFTKTRELVLEYYPEDIRKKKISACCMALAQTGQYNLERMTKRNDRVTTQIIISRFNESAIAMVFLLNKVFRPYYKWSYKRMRELPILGKEVGNYLYSLADIEGFDAASLSERKKYVSEICSLFIKEMRNQQLSFSENQFLTFHGEEVRDTIEDKFLRSLPAQVEI